MAAGQSAQTLMTGSSTTTVPAGFDIVHVGAGDRIRVAAVARLFAAYTDSLDIDLAYQNYAAELAGLPGKYGPPDGALLLLVRAAAAAGGDTEDEGEMAAAVGCVALRALPDVDVDDDDDDDDGGDGGGGGHHYLGKEGDDASSRTTKTSSSSRRRSRRRRRRRAEIKRLYVDPAARGHGLGRALFAAVLAEARARAYDEVVLDTLAHMTEARRMYEREGFVRLEAPYYEAVGSSGDVEGEDQKKRQWQHPEGTVFYRLEL